MVGDEQALLAAVIAAPDDDLPRLVYADWLDEHGDPDRAAFIRAQCQLERTPPSDPDHYALKDRLETLLLRLDDRFFIASLPSFPSRYEPPISKPANDRRGFPDGFHPNPVPDPCPPDLPKQLAAQLSAALAATPARTLGLSNDLPAEAVRTVLSAPAAAELRGLAPGGHPDLAAERSRLLAASPAAATVRSVDYTYSSKIPADAVAALAAARLPNLRQLTVCPAGTATAAFRRLLGADWFGGLTDVAMNCGGGRNLGAAVPVLAGLPGLTTLWLRDEAAHTLAKEFAAKNGFPALGRLRIDRQPWTIEACRAFAAAELPRLRSLNLEGDKDWEWEAFAALTAADWFPRLHEWEAGVWTFGLRGLQRLAAAGPSPLRYLSLYGDACEPDALRFLAAGHFPRLTRLDLNGLIRADDGRFADFLRAAYLPSLTSLKLSHSSLGPTGGRALARNSTFGKLVELQIHGGPVGREGWKTLVSSPHLQQLLAVNLFTQDVELVAELLCDRTLWPNLKKATIYKVGDGLTPELYERFKKARGFGF